MLRGSLDKLIARSALRSVVYEHLEMRREPPQLMSPVAHHGRGTHHKRRSNPIALDQQKRNNLRSFSQPHVVGQEGAQVVALEGGQPGYAALLVGAQGALEAVGLGGDL